MRARARAWRPCGLRIKLIVAAGLAAIPAVPANAEVAATVSAFSDLRFRGYSLSEGHPVAILDFAYDDPSGMYADAAGTAVFSQGDVEPFGVQLTGGYARRLKSGTTLDFGITHSTYSNYSNAARGSSYTEIYAGVSRGALSSRIFLSPHYFETGRWTAYGEVNASVSPAQRWTIDGHVGLQFPLHAPSGESYKPQVDWRLGVSREFGRLSLHGDWSAGAPGRDYYGGRHHSRGAVVLGASWML